MTASPDLGVQAGEKITASLARPQAALYSNKVTQARDLSPLPRAA